jgi:hypothetical protein
VLTVLAVLGVASSPAFADDTKVRVAARAVLVASISAGCERCAWEIDGRESVMLRVTLDGRYSQHLAITRAGRSDYHVLLGTVLPGLHTARVEVDRARSARDLRAASDATASIAEIKVIDARDPAFLPLSLAPFVYQRANTLGRFTDTPVFMWYEVEPTARGNRYRYTVIFTNEDGGTPADRLMATWGRTTDIEYVYSVEVDRAGQVLEHDYQGPKHEVLPYRGKLEQRHARLWVSTDNNMVVDRGTTTVRYLPAPMAFSLKDLSREEVMDQQPWLYALASKELMREGKIVAGAPPGKGTIPDPRTFVYLEGCGEVGDTAVALAVQLGNTWIASDRDLPEYRIVRDGCFRVAIPLPANADPKTIRAVRVQAFARAGRDGNATAKFARLNTMFALDQN